MSKVCVIIGAYNSKNTICDAIDSMLKQTFKDFEIIICDDFSTDGTYDILLNYEKNNDNVKVLRNLKNMGLAYSLNKCLENCNSNAKYIARMDCDDICIKNRLEIQTSYLDSHADVDVVGSAMYINNGTNDMKVTKVIENPTRQSMLYGVPFAHPTIMMKKSVYDELKGYTVLPRTRRGQDLDLWFRFYFNGFKGVNLINPLLIYHEDSNDYKKRTFKTAKMYFMTNVYGYRLLKFPLYKYYRILKPFFSFLIPDFMLIEYKKWRNN